MPSITSYAGTNNNSVVTITVKLPPRESSGYYFRTDVVGSNSEVVENLLFIDIGNLSKVSITNTSSSQTKLNSVVASNYNAAESTVDLTFTYSGLVYWYLRVEALNLAQ